MPDNLKIKSDMFLYTATKPINLLSITLIGVLLLFSGCDDDPVDVAPEEEITANIEVDNPSPNPGEEVTLDASTTDVTAFENVSYQWSLEVPAGSQAELTNQYEVTTSFTPDEEGDYLVSLTVTADGLSDQTEMVIEAEAGVVELSGSISEDMTLVSGNIYHVLETVDVQARLTIEPNVEIYFEQETALEISDSGTLVANGSETEPILFTGMEEIPGWWDGIWFRDSEDLQNIIDHAIVEYAGNDVAAIRLGVFRATGSSVDAASAITNTTVQHTDGHGVYVYRGSELIEFDNNTITDNTRYPVTIRNNPAAAAAVGPGSDLTGNDTDVLRIYQDRMSIVQDITFYDPGVPYRVDDADIDVSDAILTIAEGVTMEFNAGSSLHVTSNGGLQVDGTDENPVLFTGVEPIPGFWTGINLIASDRPDNRIEYAVIEYGGSVPGFSGWNRNTGGNITLGRSISSAQLSISNSEIRDSENWGVYIYDGNLDIDEESVLFEGNQSGEIGN